MSRCIITGCRLVIPAEDKSLWGDLYECGPQTFVFNGCTAGVGREALWEYAAGAAAEEKWIIVEGDYFEKRGIVTVPAANCTFNLAALDYLSQADQ